VVSPHGVLVRFCSLLWTSNATCQFLTAPQPNLFYLGLLRLIDVVEILRKVEPPRGLFCYRYFLWSVADEGNKKGLLLFVVVLFVAGALLPPSHDIVFRR